MELWEFFFLVFSEGFCRPSGADLRASVKPSVTLRIERATQIHLETREDIALTSDSAGRSFFAFAVGAALVV